MVKTIELDCPPGQPRPGDLLDGVIEGTGLPKKEAKIRVFGCWTWDYSEIPDEQWEKIRPTLKARIVSQYKKGLIRYGSW